MWCVKGESAEERILVREQFRRAFEGLRGRIPGMLHLEVGLDIHAAVGACDVVVLTEFADQAALALYSSHPEHLRVRGELQGLRLSRHQIDYIVE
jgi:hypothetical protein